MGGGRWVWVCGRRGVSWGVQGVIGRSGEEGRSVVDMCGIEDGLGTGKEERAVALWARDR